VKPVTLITGSSAGIGMALARVFAENGHELVLAARREDHLNALAAEIAAAGHKRPSVVAVDLQSESAIASLAAVLAARDQEIGNVVNNAGFGLAGRAAKLDRAQQLAMIDLNVRALSELSTLFHRKPRAQSRRRSQRRFGSGLHTRAEHGRLLCDQGIRPFIQ
jgi:short-subunit dehydrogenase